MVKYTNFLMLSQMLLSDLVLSALLTLALLLNCLTSHYLNLLCSPCQFSMLYRKWRILSLTNFWSAPHFQLWKLKSNNLTAEVFFHDFVFIIEGCTLRAQIFADTNVCGNYFWDIGPKSWSWINRNIIKLAKSRKFAPRNTTKDYKSNTFFRKTMF